MVVFYVFMLINILIVLCNTGLASSGDHLIKEWKCVNPECTVPISEAETKISYNSPDHKLKLTFKAKDQVTVLRKPAENEKEQSLWWISLNGREGYVREEFIKEKKILNKNLVHSRKIEDHEPISISPTPAYEVSDGTTIFSEYIAESYKDGSHYRYHLSEAGYNVDNNADLIESKEEEKIEQVSKKPNIILNEIVNMNSPIPKLSKTDMDVDNTRIEHIEVVKSGKSNLEVDKLDISFDRSNESNVELGSLSGVDTSANREAELDQSSKSNFKSGMLDDIDVEVDTSANTDSELEQSSKGNVKSHMLNEIDIEVDTSANIDTELDQSSKSEVETVEKEHNTLEHELKQIGQDSVIPPALDNQTISENVNSNAINNYSFDPSINFSKTNSFSEEILDLPNTRAKLAGNERSDISHLEPQQYGIDSAEEKPIIKDTEENSIEINVNVVQSASLATNNKDIKTEDVKEDTVLLNQNNILNNNPSLNDKGHLLDSTTSSSQDINLETMSDDGQLTQSQSNKEELLVSEKDSSSNDLLLAGKNSSLSRLDFENEIFLRRHSNDDVSNVNNQQIVPLSDEKDAVNEAKKATESAENILNNSHGDQNSVIDQQSPEVVTEIAKIPSSDSTITSQHTDGDVTSSDYSLNNDISLPQTTTEFSKMPASESVITTEVQSGYLGNLQVQTSDDREDESLKENKFSEPNQNSYNLRKTAIDQEEGTRTKLDDENFQNSSQKWFSSLYSIMETLQKLYLSSLGKSSTSEPESMSRLINEPQIISIHECDQEKTTGPPNEYCRQERNVESLLSVQDSAIHISNSESEQFKEGGENIWSFMSVLWLVGSSLVILCFSLGYYYLDNVRRDGELVQKNNALASELFVLEREKAILDEDFVLLKGNVQKLIAEKNVLEDQLLVMKETLQKTKEEKNIIEEKESKLIKKLMMVEQNYNELRKIFSESKQKAERATLISDIKKLKESIAADNIEISSLKDDLQEKRNEIKSLSSILQRSQEARIALEEQIDRMVIEGQEIAREYQVTLAKMEQTIEENKVIQSKIEDDLRKQKKECESLTIQKELAESALQKAHGITSTESLADWLEVKEVRISLLSAEKEIVKLNQERDNLLESLEYAQEKSRSLTSEVEKLNEKYENAEKEKIDALTKLQVLSNYFKEKEIQLQEELGMKEAQWLQKQSDNSTIYQQMRDLREENINLKGLVETLKKEILDQEAAYKKIINTTEQKAHENWVCYRRAEVRLKEVQAEAAQLRNRLTTLETCDGNPEDKMHKTTGGLEVNGDLPGLGSAMSPPFMLYPNEFIPPPPLLPPTASGNTTSRPPPLGRISSPPLVSGDFIPPPPLLPPYEVFSHGHASPPSPPPPLLHKPQPREYHHITQSQPPSASKQKDSQSSNHSSESPHDKTPARRGKR